MKYIDFQIKDGHDEKIIRYELKKQKIEKRILAAKIKSHRFTEGLLKESEKLYHKGHKGISQSAQGAT